MLQDQRRLLDEHPSEYISIGITDHGNSVGRHPVVWEGSAHAYNMRIPDVYLTPEDLEDQELMTRLENMKVRGLYIFSNLKDYGFISRFKELFDLNIWDGRNIKSLDFLNGIEGCKMLFLANARLENADAVAVEKLHTQSFRTFACVGLYRCEIEDITPLENPSLYFSEFLVWEEKERHNPARWERINAGTKQCYVLEEKK